MDSYDSDPPLSVPQQVWPSAQSSLPSHSTAARKEQNSPASGRSGSKTETGTRAWSVPGSPPLDSSRPESDPVVSRFSGSSVEHPKATPSARQKHPRNLDRNR